jgi:hypothetical protein
MNTKLNVVLAVMIGAGVTWLWTVRQEEPAATGSSPATLRVTAQGSAPSRDSGLEPSEPVSSSKEAVRSPDSTSRAMAVTPPVNATSAIRDDATYDRMLAIAQTYPDWLDIRANLTKMHERFVLTSDDPDWARPMEKSLREFFNARTAGKPFEFTSVSCRSGRCEVQVQVQLDRRADPGGEVDRQQQKMLEPIHDTRPLGHSVLRQDAIESVPMEDRVGILISYQQVEPESAADPRTPAPPQ